MQDKLALTLSIAKGMEESMRDAQTRFAELIIKAAGIDGDALSDEQEQLIEAAFTKVHHLSASIVVDDTLRELKETR